ncbi:hypothetical protein D3C71_1319100 [compost metagenome]
MNLPDQRQILGSDLIHGRNWLLRNDEHMNRRCRLDIVKRQNPLVLKHLVAGNAALDNFAENGLHTHNSSYIDSDMFIRRQ